MNGTLSATLVNPQNGNLAFKILPFANGDFFGHVQRNNFYSLIWVTEGRGVAKADFSEYAFEAGTLFAFSPYQPFMLKAVAIKGFALYFHPDFFCIHKHQVEVACHGVLFNNIYEPPSVPIDQASAQELKNLLHQMKEEMLRTSLAQNEILVSYLKIFLILASRIKAKQQPGLIKNKDAKEPFILQGLRDAIERDFKKKHLPRDYANTLNISAKALGRITKTHFRKTLTQLISDRIIIEAKRELYLTNKTVKEIAHDLGYVDEYYFSRFFKMNAEVSPQLYRETVGVGRG